MNNQSSLDPSKFQDLNDHDVGRLPNWSNSTNDAVTNWCGGLHQSNYVRLPGIQNLAQQGSQDRASTEHRVSFSTTTSQQTLARNRVLLDARAEHNESDTSPSPVLGQQIVATSSAIETAKLAFRRRRGRLHQARYRCKKARQLHQLEDSLEILRQEIHQLNMYKHATSLYLSTNATALGVVVEYFRLFRFGVQQDVPTSEDMYGKEEAMVQRSFLNTAMAPNVTDGVVVGLLKLVDSWKFMSRCFHGIDIQPIRIVLGPGCVLNAAAKCSITITENTIRLAFPDLINDTAGRIIAEKLVDQEFTMYGTFEFKYDEQSGRITSIQSKFDMLTPVLRLLGCLKDVARIFENAVITPECRIRVTRREILLS